MAKSFSPPSCRQPFRALVPWWCGFEGHSPGPLLGSGTVRNQGGEQRAAATEKSPTVLLCTNRFGPINDVMHWAGEERMMR